MTGTAFSFAGRRVWVAGHRGMVGSALTRRLASEGCEILKVSRTDLDLCRQGDVEAWMADNKPDAIFMAAAIVGGIHANSSQPADFIYENLMIEANIIHAACNLGVSRLLFLGSSCIYPKFAPQPIPEEAILTSALEPTNQWYAVAKIAGLKLCKAYRKQYGCDFISVMPTNLYGPYDNFDLMSGHVLPSLLRKIHEAKLSGKETVEIWGTGKVRREFMYVDDLADACVFLMKNYHGDDHINVGTGEDLEIVELARTIADVVGYDGGFTFNSNQPDGTPRKLLDVSKLTNLGWSPRTGLRDGIVHTYQWYKEHSGEVAVHAT